MFMSKDVVYRASENLTISQKSGFGGNSKILNINPYQVVPRL